MTDTLRDDLLAIGAKAMRPYTNDEDSLEFAKRELSAAISAIEAAGYVVVQREPTEAMVEAGKATFDAEASYDYSDELTTAYKAIIEAAEVK